MDQMLDREELLKKLHALPFCMYLTALLDECCIEVSVVSSKGTSYSWESFGDFAFRAYCLNGLSKNKIATIKEHIASKSFFIADLNRTQLKKIVPIKDESQELSDLFVNFLELPDKKLDLLYCYSDSETGLIYVSDTQEGLSDILNDLYPVGTLWENYSDEQLKECLAEYEDIECEIPFIDFD